MTGVSVVSVKMAVKKKDSGDAGLFYLLFCTVYCNENRLKNNLTPYEPRHKKTCLGTDHLIFWGWEVGGGGWVFSSRFSSDRKTEIFFLTVREPKYFFQDKAKTKYIFFLNSIYMYARNVFF